MTLRGLTTHKVHQSLIRTPLYAGVDKSFLIFEITLLGFLFFVVGFRLTTFLIAGLWGAVIHPVMVWISAKDPLLAVLYVRSLSGRDFYAPHGGREGRPVRVKRAIPKKK